MFLEGQAGPHNNPNVNYPFFFMVQAVWHKVPYLFFFNSDIMTGLKCIITD